MSESPSQAADRALSDPESTVVPLGRVKVRDNSGSRSLTLPAEPSRGLGIEPGDEMHVGYDPVTGEFKFVPATRFDGWE